jgi:hypothetical protein
MRRAWLFALAALAIVGLCSLSNKVFASPKIALNVDGQSDYSTLAPWANIAGQFDPTRNLTYWNGYLDGTYRVTWTGSAAPSIIGGQSSFSVTGPGQGILDLRHSTPGPNGGGTFHLQLNGAANLNILAPDTVPGTPFRQPFLDKVNRLVHGSVIRYMDWMQTNRSPVVNWSDRNTSVYQTTAAGVSYENIVALSNAVSADAWVNIPHMATDDYVRNFARFLKANLKPGLRVHVEYSNELWNGGDQGQGTWNLMQARADPQFNSRTDDTGKMALRAAERLRQIVTIFKQEWGTDYKTRVVPEIGGFIANAQWAQWQIDWLKAKGVNLAADNYRVAIAPYVPGSEGDLSLTGTENKDQIFSRLYNFMNGPIKTWIQQNKTVADAAGVKLDSYEAAAGSFYAVLNPANKALLSTFLDMQNDPRIGKLQRDLITMWDTESGGGLYNAFGLVSPYSQYGQWGLLSDVNATGSLKFDAVAAFVGPTSGVTNPEPGSLGVLGACAAGLCCRRGRRAI